MFRTIRRTALLKLYLTIFILNITTNMVTAIQVPYILELGGGVFEVNLVTTISSTIGILFLFPFGVLSDRFGRKLMLIIPMVLQLIGYVIYGLADDTYPLIIGALFNGFVGMEFLPVLHSMVADVSELGERQEVFSLFFFFSSAAMLLGPSISTFLLRVLGVALRNIYQIATIIMVFFIIYLGTQITETFIKTKEKVNYGNAISSLLRQRNFQYIIMIALSFAFWNSIIQTYVPLLGINYLQLSNAEVSSLAIYRNLSILIIRLLTPIILTKMSSKRFLILALVLEGVTGFATVLINNYSSISIQYFLTGLVHGIVQNLLVSLLADISRPESRGIANSIHMGASGLGKASKILTTPIANTMGLISVFLIGGIVGLISIPIATRLSMRNPSPTNTPKSSFA